MKKREREANFFFLLLEIRLFAYPGPAPYISIQYIDIFEEVFHI